MEFPSSLKKSSRKSSHDSLSSSSSFKQQKQKQKHTKDDDLSNLEEQPILFHDNDNNVNVNCREVIVKIDPSGTVDPPTKLIERQQAAGAETPFNVNYNDNRSSYPPPSIPIDKKKVPPKDIKVSFQAPDSDDDDDDQGSSEAEDEVREMRSNNISSQFQSSKRPPIGENRMDNGEVLKCTSYQRRQSVLRTKTRSRILDNPETDQTSSGKVNNTMPNQVRNSRMMNQRASGMVKGPNMEEEEEEDPFMGDDIPDEYKKGKLSVFVVFQWVSLLLIIGALICTLVIKEWKDYKFKALQLWKWDVLILVLICGRLVSGWVVRLIVFSIERNFLLRKRVLYFVYGIKNAVQNCIWLGLVLLAWSFLFDEKIEEQTHTEFLKYVSLILLCLLVGCILWLIKTLLVKVLASSFHVSTFFDRIQDSLFNQYVIETLSGPPSIEIQNIQEDEERAMADIQEFQSMGIDVPPELKAATYSKSGGLPRPPLRTMGNKFLASKNNNKQDPGIPIDDLHRWNPKNISAWNMKRLMKITRHGVLSTLDEQIHDSSNEDETSTQIRNEREAKTAAKKIFQNVARRGSKHIYLLDLMRFMQEDEALKTISLLAGSTDTEKISKSTLKNWVVNAFRERKALALTLNDTKTAVNKLHHMVNVIVAIIIIIVSLLILGLFTTKFLYLLSSQVVIVAFVFGNTCRTIFESIIFLFVMHPFDVGDRCEVDGVQMIVEEMNILNTIFLRFDNQKIYYPNSTLSQKPLGNFYRSPDMSDTIEFFIQITTPAEKIAMMKQRIVSYIESKKDHWYPSPTIYFIQLDDLHRVKLALNMRHRINHQDMKERWARRATLVEEMTKIFKEFDTEYRLIPLDINIRSMPDLTPTRTPPSWGPPPNQ